MNDIYKNIEDYNPNKKRKILIVFDNMIADMLSNKILNPIVIELFIRDEFDRRGKSARNITIWSK